MTVTIRLADVEDAEAICAYAADAQRVHGAVAGDEVIGGGQTSELGQDHVLPGSRSAHNISGARRLIRPADLKQSA